MGDKQVLADSDESEEDSVLECVFVNLCRMCVDVVVGDGGVEDAACIAGWGNTAGTP